MITRLSNLVLCICLAYGCASVCRTSVESTTSPSSVRRISRVELRLGGFPESDDEVITISQCDDLRKAVEVLDRRGFFSLPGRLEDPDVADGCRRTISVVFVDGTTHDVADLNANDPVFMQIVAELRVLAPELDGECWGAG